MALDNQGRMRFPKELRVKYMMNDLTQLVVTEISHGSFMVTIKGNAEIDILSMWNKIKKQEETISELMRKYEELKVGLLGFKK